jgi:hypothetical protein
LVELSHDPGDKSDTERKMLTLSWGSEHPSTTVTNVTFTSAETALEVCEAIEDGIEGEKNVAKQQALNNMQRRFGGSNKVSWSTYYNSDAEDNLNEDVEEDAKNIEEDVETKNDKKKKPPINTPLPKRRTSKSANKRRSKILSRKVEAARAAEQEDVSASKETKNDKKKKLPRNTPPPKRRTSKSANKRRSIILGRKVAAAAEAAALQDLNASGGGISALNTTHRRNLDTNKIENVNQRMEGFAVLTKLRATQNKEQ